jgi:hypothetical protein
LYFYINIQLRFRAETATIPPHRQAVAVACKRTATRQPAFRQTMKINKFNFKILFITTIICGLFTFITFIAVFGIDEGTIEKTFLTVTLEKLFYVFRFPTHTFFFDKMKGDTFVWGLFLNCLFYGLIVERLFSLNKKKKNEL